MNRFIRWSMAAATSVALALLANAESPPGEQPALGSHRITQEQIVFDWTLEQIQEAGRRIFTTPFNRHDGLGDGRFDPLDSLSPGGRPTLQGNGTFLRVNGLDSQTCLDCHSVVSSATSPPTLGVGGAGSANNNAIIMATRINPADLDDLDGRADFNGRFANPPFVFGAGAVELLALEMTMDLQALKARAIASPSTEVALESKGVSFGTISADGHGNLDLSGVEGISGDLVVRPFGRKGEFATIREFDVGALQFHFGMQPTEVVGSGVDGDEDGVIDEVTVGELSALSIFIATLDRPYMDRRGASAQRGFALFEEIGCAGCHMPSLETESRELPLRFPEIPTDPLANVYYSVELSDPSATHVGGASRGIAVLLFADLKRHEMGEALAEDFALADERTNLEYTTARLWGVADSGPYLHDGRATTLTEAILFHGGEALSSRDAFDALGDEDRIAVLEFLRSLRTPKVGGEPGWPGEIRKKPS